MKPSRHRSVGKGDLEAELSEFSGKTGGEAGAFCALEVVGTEVGVKDAASEQPIDGGEDGGGDGDDCLARAASRREPGEEGTKVAALFAACRPGDLDEQGLEPRGSFAELGGAALAGTLVVPGAQAGPGDQVCGGREARHVDADLGDDDGSGDIADAGDRGQSEGCLAKGFEPIPDLRINFGNRRIDVSGLG